MFKIFDPDSLFSRVMTVLFNMMVLNVLWLVCSLPVLTFGASSAALYTVLFKMRDDLEGRVARQFFAALVQNWKRATGTWLVLLAVAVVCGLDLTLALQVEGALGTVLTVIAMAGLQVAGMVCTFLFPLLARYENTWRAQMKNAALLAVGNLPRLLLCWLFWAVAIVATVWSVNTLYVMLPFWILIGYSALSWLTLKILGPVFVRLEAPAEEEA